MFTGLEAQNRAQEFKVEIKLGRDVTASDVAEALRVIAERIEGGTVNAGLVGFADVGSDKHSAYWAFGKGVRD
jgi:hypothetical protein